MKIKTAEALKKAGGVAPMVSVLMPIKNARLTVARAVGSVVNQTYDNIEVVCVDDGSDDGTDDVVMGLAFLDARVQYYRLERGHGIGAARNVALDLAKGDYICFVDSDDEVEPTYIESMIYRILTDGTQAACCGWDRGSGVGVRTFAIDDVWRRERILDELQGCRSFFTSLWNKMFSAKLVKIDGVSVPFSESFRIGEDEEWLSRVLRECDGCSVVPEVLYHWYQNEGSLTSDATRETDERRQERISLYERKYHNLSQCGNVGVKIQARLAAELTHFVAVKYMELGPVALEQYDKDLYRARFAAEVPGGGSFKMEIQDSCMSHSTARSSLVGEVGV